MAGKTYKTEEAAVRAAKGNWAVFTAAAFVVYKVENGYKWAMLGHTPQGAHLVSAYVYCNRWRKVPVVSNI